MTKLNLWKPTESDVQVRKNKSVEPRIQFTSEGMRIDLNVPYKEKDDAKALGCRWDAARKTWYIIAQEDITQFIQWFKPEHRKPYTDKNKVPFIPNKKHKKNKVKKECKSKRTIGANFVESSDDSLPWVDSEEELDFYQDNQEPENYGPDDWR